MVSFRQLAASVATGGTLLSSVTEAAFPLHSRAGLDSHLKPNRTSIPKDRCSLSHRFNATGSIHLPKFWAGTDMTVSITVSTNQTADDFDQEASSGSPSSSSSSSKEKDDKTQISQNLWLTPYPIVNLRSDDLPVHGCVAVLVDRAGGEIATSRSVNSPTEAESCSGVLSPICLRDLTRASNEYAKRNVGISTHAGCKGLKVPASCPYALEIATGSIGNPNFLPDPRANLNNCTGATISAKNGTISAGSILRTPLDADSVRGSNLYDDTIRSAVPVVLMAWARDVPPDQEHDSARWSSSRVICLTPDQASPDSKVVEVSSGTVSRVRGYSAVSVASFMIMTWAVLLALK